ncbi:MAG: hypothetical protein RL235_1122 [Chlamydiota bacterium]|jgi:hypothetical protein
MEINPVYNDWNGECCEEETCAVSEWFGRMVELLDEQPPEVQQLFRAVSDALRQSEVDINIRYYEGRTVLRIHSSMEIDLDKLMQSLPADAEEFDTSVRFVPPVPQAIAVC